MIARQTHDAGPRHCALYPVGAVWVLVVVIVFFVNSLIYEDEAPSRPSDGWCDRLPLGVPDGDDPDCEGWDARRSAPGV